MTCSDLAFRWHYRLLLHTPPVLDAVAALKRAMESDAEKENS